jgi:hypothetical protein
MCGDEGLQVSLIDDAIHVGQRCRITCQRTLRIPDDGGPYPLPPGLGRIPIHRCADFPELPPGAPAEAAFFIPMFQCEALWLSFEAARWKPNAAKVGIGGINAVSGEAWDTSLRAEPQDYIVVPDQPWLDGINVGRGVIRQFVAVPLGSGQSVEAQLTGSDEIGGIQLVVFEPKPGKFPDEAPPQPPPGVRPPRAASAPGRMGLGAGGRMTQKVYPDRYGVDTWDTDNCVSLSIHIVNSSDYHELTGNRPPPPPISAATYTEFGLPWFELYDEEYGDVEASERLQAVRSVEGEVAASGKGLDVPDSQVQKLNLSPEEDADG